MATSKEELTKPPSEIKKIIVDDTPPERANATEQAENRYYYEKLEIDGDIQRQHLLTLKQNNEDRKKYARHLFIVTCIWSGVILAITIASGVLTSLGLKFLSDKVLITLITTTTANFFGFFLLVVKYLFNTNTIPSSKKKKGKKNNKLKAQLPAKAATKRPRRAQG